MKDEATKLQLSVFMEELSSLAKELEEEQLLEDGASTMAERVRKQEERLDVQVVDSQNSFGVSIPITEEGMLSMLKEFRSPTRRNIDSESFVGLLEEAKAVLSTGSNVTRLPPLGRGQRLTVVGDLHGSLDDLFGIFDRVGLPSPSNQFIFNGDFVDRGPWGVEVCDRLHTDLMNTCRIKPIINMRTTFRKSFRFP